MQAPPLKTVRDVFFCQAAAAGVGLIVVLICARSMLLSFFLGEAVMLLGNGFLAWRVYRQNKRLVPLSILWGFLGGETGKYVVLFVLTLVIAKTIPLNWLFYVIGIAVPQLCGVILYFIWKSIHLKN